MIVVSAARYRINIGLHVFPTEKYRLVYECLVGDGGTSVPKFVEAEPATWEQLALVHSSEYLAKLRHGTLTGEDLAQLELPWSIEVVEGFRLMVGGTIRAAEIATGAEVETENSERRTENVEPRIVCHVGGGLHHAFPNHGEGFCPFNDVAVATRVLQTHGIERIAIVDLDVHHGNGTAFIFESDPHVFTFSMHQQHNYPMWKPKSTLDIGLADGTRDAMYLEKLAQALPDVMAHRPQCVFYLAGADPYEDDQLGGLRLTKEGLRLRDRLVIDAVRSASVPLVIVLAGGYARRVEDTVAIHCATIDEALKRSRTH